VELNNLFDAPKINERFRADERVEAIDLELKDAAGGLDGQATAIP
jgi:translation elongation factor P/translation initiation factor 5A